MTEAHTTLIQPAELDALLRTAPGAVLVCDCSFDLANTEAGAQAFVEGHIPGAVYLHLDDDLSGAKTGRNGRHPLPERAAFVRRMAQLGAHEATQIVAYDNSAGMYAARLWWMLRWVGHRAAAVLDGGLAAWRTAGLPLEAGAAKARPPGAFIERAPLVSLASLQTVRENLQGGPLLVVDARAADRFRGENETLDPIGGHIPGARNRPFRDNLQADGRFKPAAQLAAELDTVAGGKPAAQVVHQCGSGVTACHNLLAMEVAGRPGSMLYAGSWSEWSAQPGAPIATGPA